MAKLKRRYYVVAGLTLLMILVTALLSPWTSGLSQHAISKSQISVFPADINALLNRYHPGFEGSRKLGVLRFEDAGKPHKFHFSFDESELENESVALYVPSIAASAYITVNGVPMTGETARSIYAPGLGPNSLYLNISRNVISPGHNRLHIHYASDAHKTGLRSVYLGPRSVLRNAFERQILWQRLLPIIGLVLTGFLILGAFTGVYYSQRVGPYLLLALLLTLSAAQFFSAYIYDRSPFESFFPALKFLFPASIIAVLLWFYKSQKDASGGMNALTCAALIFAFIGGLAGLLLLTRFSPDQPLFWVNLTLASPVPLALFWLTSNLPMDLVQHKSRMSQLIEQVSEQAAQLDENSRLIAEQMKKSAVMEERQRFTRDIHDGIGGQLVSLLLRARRGKVGVPQMVSEIQSSVNDLRLIVDSMDHVGNDLESALLTLRARIERQLSAGRIELIWEQSDNLDYSFTDPRHVLNLYRFIQEAVTNIVRHSEANEAKVVILQGETADDLRVEISDNGKGMDFSQPIQSGKGLRSLKERADILGGDFVIEAGEGGTGLSVRLKL